MVNKDVIKVLLSKMTDDIHANIKKIRKEFGSLDYTDEENQSILHILVDNKYNEKECFLAIKSLLEVGLSPNLQDDFKYNFIQTALYAGYSEEFILNIIKEALKYGLDVNHVDEDKDTIVHTAIYSDDYSGRKDTIYILLCDNGFDSTLKDKEGKVVFEAMRSEKKYTLGSGELTVFGEKWEEIVKNNNNQSKEAKPIYNTSSIKKEVNLTPIVSLSGKDIKELEKYGKVLNNKNYIVSPTIGREKELKNLIITLAQDKKRPIIVGESGVGKTAIVDELAYRIQTGDVPNFLKGKVILEVNPSDIVAGCQYTGMFEQNMTNLMNLCERLDVIVFIDEIHTIYGVGRTEHKNNDMASMLKHYIDRSNLKVIGTTTEKEYNEFFSSDALKRRFEKITVKEPTEEILYQIIDKVIKDYSIKTGITFENESMKNKVINVIMDATKKNCRFYNDVVNNPDLSISIIDKAFAFAKFYDSEFITKEHFIESFEYCDRLYQPSKDRAIITLKSLNKNISKPKEEKEKVLTIDFNITRK